jgi:hypothetical protein
MANKMKAKQSENNFKATLSQILGRGRRGQVSLLALNVGPLISATDGAAPFRDMKARGPMPNKPEL